MDNLRTLTYEQIEDIDQDSKEATGDFIAGEDMYCNATNLPIAKGQRAYLWHCWVLRNWQQVRKFEATLELE